MVLLALVFLTFAPFAFAHWTELRNVFKKTVPDSIENELVGNFLLPKYDDAAKKTFAPVYPNILETYLEPNPPEFSDVPLTDIEFNFRVYATNCTYPQPKRQVNVVNKSEKRLLHLPFGVPFSPEDNRTLRLLYNEDYILAFDLKYRIPMWTAFTLDGKRDGKEDKNTSWTGDARISFRDGANCGDYDEPIVKNQYIIQRPLYPPGFSSSLFQDQAFYVTNSIPKSLNFSNILEEKMNQILSEWAKREGYLNILMGPAFDILGTGMRPDIGTIMRTHELHGPLIVPTHIFVIATWCSEKTKQLDDCQPSKLLTHGFLLPNKPFPVNFELAKNLIQQSTCSVIDIEKLTGVSFFTGLPFSEATRLRTTIPQGSI